MEDKKVLKIITIALFVVLFISLAIYLPYEYFYNSRIYELDLNIGDKYLLNITDPNVTYESSNPEIATVDNTGIINVVNFGKAKITVKDKNNKMKYRYDITVEDNGVAGLELYPLQLEINVGDTYQLVYKYISSEIPDSVIWESTNFDIVSIDENGIVTGLKEGKSTIKLTVDGIERECVVNVSSTNIKVEPNYVVQNTEPTPTTTTTTPTTTTQPSTPAKQPTTTVKKPTQTTTTTPTTTKVAVTGISVNPSAVTIKVGQTVNVTTTITPSNATNQNVTWKSSDTSVATISNGIVKGVKAGTTTITVTTVDGNKTATVKVTVTEDKKQETKTEQKPQAVVTTNKQEVKKEVVVESIESDVKDKTIFVGSTYQIATIIKPSEAKTTLKYESSNNSVATVSDKGIVTGKGKGSTIITVTSANNKSYSINITVNEVSVTPKTKTFTATFSGNGATVGSDSASCTTKGVSCKITLPSITRNGYNIIGYSTNANSTIAGYKPGDSVDISGDIAFYAITSRTVTATFEPAAYVSTTSVSCDMYNTNTTCRITLPSINRANYDSLGFNTNSNAANGISGTADISSDVKYYAITRIKVIDGILEGCTGWAAGGIDYYNSNKAYEGKINAGTAFTILREEGDFFEVNIPGVGTKYVKHAYVMINLSDYMPSAVYDITNAYSAIYKSSGKNIPGITGTKLYTGGKVYNLRLRRDEFMVPMVYSTAKKVLTAESQFLNDGYRLKVYDTYRPTSVSKQVANGLQKLYDSDSEVSGNINKNGYNSAYFIASSGSKHNFGAALDATLVYRDSYKEVTMPTAMHELSALAVKYTKPGSGTYASSMNDIAKYYDRIMKSSTLTGIEGEWWHFQEKPVVDRINNVRDCNGGCNFQVTAVYSY